MKRRRDSETGEYISIEESGKRDRATWTEEKDFNKGKFLQDIFDSLLLKTYLDVDSRRVVKLKDLEGVFSKFNREINMNKTFINKMNAIIKDLNYISETDSKVLPFLSGKIDILNRESILYQTNNLLSTKIEEIDFETFFDNLIENQRFLGEVEEEVENKYLALRKFLKHYLNNLKVYKIGEIQIDIYIVGLDLEGNLRGVQTRVIET